MKILQICPIFPPSPLNFGSGVTTVVYYLSKELVRRGHKVTVYTSAALDRRRRIENVNNPLIVDGIEVHYFPYIAHYHTSFITQAIIPYMRKNIKNFVSTPKGMVLTKPPKFYNISIPQVMAS
ncbi:MAG: glycosyltransferase [Candidatus Methanoperedenaceae archaeon]|nr:glycosyltransferase [Candidatus Methanoperedenaceae archaeon]